MSQTVVIFYASLYLTVLVAVGFCLWMAERPTGPAASEGKGG